MTQFKKILRNLFDLQLTYLDNYNCLEFLLPNYYKHMWCIIIISNLKNYKITTYI